LRLQLCDRKLIPVEFEASHLAGSINTGSAEAADFPVRSAQALPLKRRVSFSLDEWTTL
jgi:hypothetical protein